MSTQTANPRSLLHPLVRRFRVRYEMRWAGLDFRGRRDEYTVTMNARWPSEIRRRWSSSHPGTTLLEVNPANDELCGGGPEGGSDAR